MLHIYDVGVARLDPYSVHYGLGSRRRWLAFLKKLNLLAAQIMVIASDDSKKAVINRKIDTVAESVIAGARRRVQCVCSRWLFLLCRPVVAPHSRESTARWARGTIRVLALGLLTYARQDVVAPSSGALVSLRPPVALLV